MSQVQSPPLDPATPDPHGKVTYEEFLAGDWGTNHVEWVDGDVVMMAAVSDEHTHVTVFLISALSAYVGAKKLGAILSEPYQMKLAAGNRGRAPDVMFVAETNLPRVTKTYLNGPADLAVEVVSPGSVATDRGAKFDEYEQGGVREYWLIDPLRKQAEFYERGADGLFHQIPVDAGVVRSRVLDGLWLKVEWLWDRPAVLAVLREWGMV